MQFHALVEEIRSLDLAGKQEIKTLLEKLLIEERRSVIAVNAQEALTEYEQGELQFSDDLQQLQRMLNA